MARRMLPLFLIVMLLPSLLAVPVFAAESDDPWLNLLDYGTVNDSGSNRVSINGKSGSIWLDLPYTSDVYTVDIVISSAAPITSASVSRESTSSYSCTIYPLGGELYRLVADCNGYDFSRLYINLSFQSIINLNFVAVRSCNIGLANTQSVRTEAQLWSMTHFTDTDYVHRDTFTESSGTVFEYFNAVDDDFGFSGCYVVPYWQSYDYIDLYLGFGYGSVSSITANINGLSLPVEVSYLNDTDSAWENLYVSVRIDLTGLDKTTPNSVCLYVTGHGISLADLGPTASNYLCIYECYGTFLVEEPNFFVYWFGQMEKWISDQTDRIVSAIVGSEDSSQVTDSINNAVNDLHQAGAAMDAVSRPDIGQVNIDVAGMVSPSGLSAVATLVNVFTSNSLIMTIMVMALTLALISFILFGKR